MKIQLVLGCPWKSPNNVHIVYIANKPGWQKLIKEVEESFLLWYGTVYVLPVALGSNREADAKVI